MQRQLSYEEPYALNRVLAQDTSGKAQSGQQQLSMHVPVSAARQHVSTCRHALLMLDEHTARTNQTG